MNLKHKTTKAIFPLLVMLLVWSQLGFGRSFSKEGDKNMAEEMKLKCSVTNLLDGSAFQMDFNLEGGSIREGAVLIQFNVDKKWIDESRLEKRFYIKSTDSVCQLARLLENSDDRHFKMFLKVPGPDENKISLNKKIIADFSIYKQQKQLFQERVILWIFRKMDPPSFGQIRVSSPFGMRTHPVTGAERSFHQGVDIAYPIGTRIYSSWEGIVQEVGYNRLLGKYVKVRHIIGGENYLFIYGHADKILVSEGDNVKKGNLLLLSGSTGRVTGPHLHFQVNHRGKTLDPEATMRFR